MLKSNHEKVEISSLTKQNVTNETVELLVIDRLAQISSWSDLRQEREREREMKIFDIWFAKYQSTQVYQINLTHDNVTPYYSLYSLFSLVHSWYVLIDRQ